MGLTVASDALSATPMVRPYRGEGLFLTTWRFGLTSNEAAWQTLDSGGSLLDAIEQGIRTCELDPAERSVGLGGRPDRDGVVTLDACIMDHLGNAGAVVLLLKIGGDPLFEVLCLAHIEEFLAHAPEPVDPGRAGQALEKGRCLVGCHRASAPCSIAPLATPTTA